MLTPVPPTECMTARQATSARLDGQVTELEATRLDAHLLACPECRAFAASIAGVAAEIQAAPLERPSRVDLLPARRRMPVVALAAAAALIAAVTVSSFAVGRVLGAHGTAKTSFAGTADAGRVRQDSTQQHLLAMLNSLEFAQPTHTARMHAV
jgi:predicted anti-sigma-YlaC factor YlaD